MPRYHRSRPQISVGVRSAQAAHTKRMRAPCAERAQNANRATCTEHAPTGEKHPENDTRAKPALCARTWRVRLTRTLYVSPPPKRRTASSAHASAGARVAPTRRVIGRPALRGTPAHGLEGAQTVTQWGWPKPRLPLPTPTRIFTSPSKQILCPDGGESREICPRSCNSYCLHDYRPPRSPGIFPGRDGEPGHVAGFRHPRPFASAPWAH